MKAVFLSAEKWFRNFFLQKNIVPPEASRLYQPNTFYTWHRRPRSLDSIEVFPTEGSHSVALVIQGPILRRHSFTLESLKFYRRLLPESQIVLSTWEGLNSDDKQAFQTLEIELVENKIPEFPGPGNLNFQVKSTRAGLQRIQNSDLDLVVKLRTDQRIYNPNAFEIMRELLFVYPRQDTGFRIGATSLNSFLNRPFSLSDMLQFSSLESLTGFWNLPEVTKDAGEAIWQGNYFPEAVLVTAYLKSRGWIMAEPGETWRRAVAQEFLIADSNSLDQFWQKHSKREHLWRRYGKIDALHELDFGAWLKLKNSCN